MLPNTNELLTDNTIIETIPSRTYKLNITNNKIFNFVDELEALKQLVYMILNTERYKYIIYSWNYGIELNDLYGEPTNYVCAELERRITEALIQDERIISTENFNFEINKGQIVCTFVVNTVFGNAEIEKVVNI